MLQVQEYIEAATFCRFCKTGTLLSLDEINDSLLALSDKSVEPLQINVLDYILGVNTNTTLVHSVSFPFLCLLEANAISVLPMTRLLICQGS
jgi:hypothetical protein